MRYVSAFNFAFSDRIRARLSDDFISFNGIFTQTTVNFWLNSCKCRTPYYHFFFCYKARAMYKARAIYHKGTTSESKTKNQIETDYITIKCHFNQSTRIYTAKWDILIFVITSAQQNRMEMFQNDIKQTHKTYTDTPKKRLWTKELMPTHKRGK